MAVLSYAHPCPIRSPIYDPTVGKGGGGFTPASLFSGGKKGAWYDPSDLTTMFQTGTRASPGTPVTSNNDPVGLILDKSGNNNDWTSSSTARPLYKTSGGLSWLEFDGTNSVLSTPISGLSTMMDMYAVLTPNAGETLWITGYNTALDASKYIGRLAISDTPTMSDPVQPAMGYVNRVKIVPDIQTTMMTALNIGSGLPKLVEFRSCNMSPWTAFAFGGFGGGYQFAGRLYGLILAPYTSATNRAPTQAYLAQKAALTLPAPPSELPALATLGDSTIAAYASQNNVPDYITGIGESFNFAVPGQTIAQQQARWNALTDYTPYRAVIVQVGLNDMNPAESAATALARLQSCINDVNSRKPAGCPTIISKMTPAKARWLALYGGTNGPIAQQKWLDMNDAIAGNGGNAITGVDARITSHVPLLDDGSGNLAAAYDTGDGIHENNAGRQIVATAWQTTLQSLGVI